MHTLILLLALQVANPNEMACVGFVQDAVLPSEVYIAAVENEGKFAFAVQGQLIYLNGPMAASLRVGDIRRIVRPEGKLRHPSTGSGLGIYYQEIGKIRVEKVGLKSATGRVLLSCQPMLKGDLAVPELPKAAVQYSGDLSNELTEIPEEGLVGPIVLGANDIRQIAAGHFCFIGLGRRDGVKAGDRFTVFRPQPAYDRKDWSFAVTGAHTGYSPIRNSFEYRYRWDILLHARTVPPQVLGDIVVVDVGDRVSAARVVNSLWEIRPGDLAVRR